MMATMQVAVTASLKMKRMKPGSWATASGWAGTPMPKTKVRPMTRMFRSLKPALAIILMPLIRIIPKTVMMAPPRTAARM